jgi:CRP-like cAMP-binding protein
MLPAMSVKDIAALLRGNPVFASVSARDLDALAGLVVEESHRARDYLFLEGDPSRWLFIVKTGHVKILRHSRTGKDVVLELLGPGEVVGGVAVIEKRPYPAAAQATEPTVVFKVPAEPIIALAERHPPFIREMALMLGRRLRTAHDSVTSLAVDPVEATGLGPVAPRGPRRQQGEARCRTALSSHAAEPGRHDGHDCRDDHPRPEPMDEGWRADGRGGPPRAGGSGRAPRARRGPDRLA